MSEELLEIQTERLRLRPLSSSDAARLARLGGVPEVARMMLSFRAPWPDDDVRRWIEASQYRGRVGFRLAIELRDVPGLIGVIGLGGNPATLMFFIAAGMSGRGYATEAARGFLTWAFPRFDLSEVEADHFADNLGSGRILRRLGFEEYGQGTGVSAGRLEPAALTLYRLRRDAFEATQCNS